MPNAKTLQQFYSSEQGQKFRWFMLQEIERAWQINFPISQHEKIVGLGFAEPYRKTLEQCDSYASLSHFVDSGPVEVSEMQLPIRNSELSRVFAIHLLENSEFPQIALDEIWRSLEPDGKLMLVVPNMNSMWKKTAIIGRYNYEHKQIRQMLLTSKFTIREVRQNIFYPPEMKSELAKVINKYCPFFGAVTIYYAEKLIFQSRGRTIKVTESLLDKLMPKKKVVEA